MGKLLSGNQEIQSKIYTIRGIRVMLDRDLAEFCLGSLHSPVARSDPRRCEGLKRLYIQQSEHSRGISSQARLQNQSSFCEDGHVVKNHQFNSKI